MNIFILFYALYHLVKRIKKGSNKLRIAGGAFVSFIVFVLADFIVKIAIKGYVESQGMILIESEAVAGLVNLGFKFGLPILLAYLCGLLFKKLLGVK